MKELWIAIRRSMPSELKKTLLQTVRDSCGVVLSDKTDVTLARSYGVCVASRENGDISVIDQSMINDVERPPKPLCLRLVVKDREGEEVAIQAAEKGIDYLIISCPDWKIIPLENLIARTRGATKLFAEVSTAEEAKIALETLELGVDGILLTTEDSEEVKSALKTLADFDQDQDDEGRRILLTRAKVTHISQLGMGARVCIDTCDLMTEGEGMLVGSSSSGLFLVQAEVWENPHVEPRPFRVNAGPVALYVLVPGGNTRYLSELRAGDEVMVVDREGRSRTAIVGRIKIERRPLMLMVAEAHGNEVKTIVQNAETIRLVAEKGSKSVTELDQGDEVLVFQQRGGRHFGTLVEEETIIER